MASSIQGPPAITARRSSGRSTSVVNRGVLVATLAAASSLGCSGPTDAPGGEAPRAEAAPKRRLDPREPGASVVCGSQMMSDGRPEIEMYMVYAMNHKLNQFPEFASAIGMDVVSDCESARQYLESYREYASDHPGFDATESLARLPPDHPLTTELDPPDAEEIEKILNGQTVEHNPLVKIISVVPETAHVDWGFSEDGKPGGKTLCTGTFINKNWILTAAHCLTLGAVYKCLKDGTAPLDCEPEWENYNAPYTLSGTKGPDNAPSSKSPWGFSSRSVRGYVHPNWIGRNMAFNSKFCPNRKCDVERFPQIGKWDLGLLYVPSHFYDDRLPPKVEAENGALRLSTNRQADVANWPTKFYGYGTPAMGELRQGTMVMQGPAELVQDPRWEDYAGFLIRGVLPPFGTPGNHQMPCGGDSGGPLVRTGLSLQAHGGVKTGQEVIVGVASFGSSVCGLPTTDQPWRELDAGWARVDEPVARDFIESTMKKSNWPPYTQLDCTERAVTSVPNEAPALECWGKPCKMDIDCKDNSGVKKACAFSGRYFAPRQMSCAACDAAGGGCDCIVGQCAPTP